MPTAVGLEAARRAFLAGEWSEARAAEVLRPAVAASWARCRRGGLDPETAIATFQGLDMGIDVGPDPGKEVFDAFAASGARCSLVLVDTDGLVRSRVDADPDLGRLLDGVLFVPGYGYAESSVGTTAAAVALHEQPTSPSAGPSTSTPT